jgi:hypothetical protein
VILLRNVGSMRITVQFHANTQGPNFVLKSVMNCPYPIQHWERIDYETNQVKSLMIIFEFSLKMQHVISFDNH